MSPPTHPVPPGPPTGSAHERELELEVAREIAEAFLTAASPLEVYRLALGRLTPLVGASFASVFLRDDDDPRLLRLACAQNWPQASARFLGELRVREGRGPTGRAVLRGTAVEVEDIFSDRALKEWWEPARELGFVSMTAHPLIADDHVFGALSFYFRERQRFDDHSRTLLGVVAHQLATTAERASLIVDLRSSKLRLDGEEAALVRKIASVEAALDQIRSPPRRLRPDRPATEGESG